MKGVRGIRRRVRGGVFRREECLGGEDGTEGKVQRGWVEVGKGIVGRLEGQNAGYYGGGASRRRR